MSSRPPTSYPGHRQEEVPDQPLRDDWPATIRRGETLGQVLWTGLCGLQGEGRDVVARRPGLA